MSKQFCSMPLGTLYLERKTIFVQKRLCHRVTFPFAGLWEECQSCENFMKMSAYRSAEEPGCRSILHISHYSVALFSFLTLSAHYLSRSVPWIWRNCEDGSVPQSIFPWRISWFTPNQLSLSGDPKEQSLCFSQCTGLCDACPLPTAVKWAGFSLHPLCLHTNQWEPL